MPPRKQPNSLFKLCVNTCIILINYACYVIKKRYPENKFEDCEREAYALKCHLMSILPARLFDVLCLRRTCCPFHGYDPRLLFHVLTHPEMRVFRVCYIDNDLTQHFWIQNLPNFTRLVDLDLMFLCTDEMLQVIGSNCLLLENINIVSKISKMDNCPIDQLILIRHVTDAGLYSMVNLKQLRILAMDTPCSEQANRKGRCVSQAGIIMLIRELPQLEELRIQFCDIGAILTTTVVDIGPLKLKKINYRFGADEGIKKLIKICPYLEELSVSHKPTHNKDAILEELALSDLKLTCLKLSFFFYSDSMQRLLAVKGSYLTHFSLSKIKQSLTLEEIISIGVHCPNLVALRLLTQSKCLDTPRNYKKPDNIFKHLRILTIGNNNYDILSMVTFFLDCTDNLQKLVLNHKRMMNIDDTLLQLIQKGKLNKLTCLWLDCTLEVSEEVVNEVIQHCEHLQVFAADFIDCRDMHNYIRKNNLNITLAML